jgi:hypothetical protein
VRFCDLPAEYEADSAASRFRRKERDEEIRVALQSASFIDDFDLDVVSIDTPAD